MTSHLPLFLNKTLGRRQGSRQDGTTETALRYFLQQSQSGLYPLAIISVHGSMCLNRQLAASAPDESELIRLDHKLYSFQDAARFDFLFYSLPKSDWNESRLLENLCYCRMLLKPEGKLCLVTKNRAPHRLLQFFNRKKAREADWLNQAGFIQIESRRMEDSLTLLCGQRPAQEF